MMIILLANTMGRATSRAASLASLAMETFSSARFSICRKMFSRITTEPSTIMPRPIANPPRLMRLAERGRLATTISVERRFPNRRYKINITSTAPCSNADSTVPTALSINSFCE